MGRHLAEWAQEEWMAATRQSPETQALWSAIGTLEKNQERQTVVLEGLMGRLEAMHKDVKDLGTQFVARMQTKWGVIFSATGVATGLVMAVGGLVYYAWSRDVDRALSEVASVNERLTEHLHGGHPESIIALINANKESIKETALSEERSLNQRFEALQQRINSLEEWCRVPQEDRELREQNENKQSGARVHSRP